MLSLITYHSQKGEMKGMSELVNKMKYDEVESREVDEIT